MISLKNLYLTVFLFTALSSCNYFMYTPRSRKAQLRERLSVLLCDQIVEFRKEYGRWPISREDITGKGRKYYEVFRDFKYSWTQFKTVDSNTMYFTYSGHPLDAANYKETNKSELNPYSGRITFFKLDGKFAWKFR